MYPLALDIEHAGVCHTLLRSGAGVATWSAGPREGRLPALLTEIHGPEGARTIAGDLRRRGFDTLLAARPVSTRGGRALYPVGFGMFALVDELTFDPLEASVLFAPSAAAVERIARGRGGGRGALRALVGRQNAWIVTGSPVPAREDGLDEALRRAGSPGPWQADLRRDRRPLPGGEGDRECDVAELYDSRGRPVAALWRQGADGDGAARRGFQGLVERVAAAAAPLDDLRAGRHGGGIASLAAAGGVN